MLDEFAQESLSKKVPVVIEFDQTPGIQVVASGSVQLMTDPSKGFQKRAQISLIKRLSMERYIGNHRILKKA